MNSYFTLSRWPLSYRNLTKYMYNMKTNSTKINIEHKPIRTTSLWNDQQYKITVGVKPISHGHNLTLGILRGLQHLVTELECLLLGIFVNMLSHLNTQCPTQKLNTKNIKQLDPQQKYQVSPKNGHHYKITRRGSRFKRFYKHINHVPAALVVRS